VRAGRLSAGHGRALLAVADPDQQAQLAADVIDLDLSVRAVEEAVRRLPPPGPPAPSPAPAPKSASVLELEEQLAERLATRVQVQLRGKDRGRIVIEFAGMEDLNRLYQTLLEGSG
jgi:ParB family chromosome partitioning protein